MKAFPVLRSLTLAARRAISLQSNCCLRAKRMSMFDGYGYTPLIRAVTGDIDLNFRRSIVQQLLDAGADIHQTTCNGETPLHCAARADEEYVLQLLQNGADVNTESAQGNAPLLETFWFGR